jgi:putative ABC transport system substrate-binding protein
MVRTGASSFVLLAGCGRLPFAQPPPTVYRVGYLSTSSSDATDLPAPGANPYLDAFRQGLREHGYVEGQNLAIEYRSTLQGQARIREFAAELVRLPVDVIVAGAGASVPAKEATETVPIVFVTGGDPVALGLVASLARPGGNVTGLPVDIQGGPLQEKRLELLKGAAPGLSRVAVIEDERIVLPAPALASQEAAAQALGLQLRPVRLQSPDELSSAFELAVQAHVDGLWLREGPLFRLSRAEIAELALKHRLPSIGATREFAQAGGLMSYGPGFAAALRRAAYYVDRILKGAKPADLPVEQPMTFDFVVNLKTARELGITFPNEIMLQVTDVIQ